MRNIIFPLTKHFNLFLAPRGERKFNNNGKKKSRSIFLPSLPIIIFVLILITSVHQHRRHRRSISAFDALALKLCVISKTSSVNVTGCRSNQEMSKKQMIPLLTQCNYLLFSKKIVNFQLTTAYTTFIHNK